MIFSNHILSQIEKFVTQLVFGSPGDVVAFSKPCHKLESQSNYIHVNNITCVPPKLHEIMPEYSYDFTGTSSVQEIASYLHVCIHGGEA